MGGKKKTKWRKLPLAEFTESPGPPAVSKNECQQELPKEEETPPPIPSYEELTVNTYQYNEYGVYTEASNMLYPTSYLVYNPLEVPVYPSYMMPPEACYYYYMPPQIPPVQEYVPMPYQEYIPPPMKDTVYLLLPAPAVTSPPGSSNTAYDWRNQRRRRRHEGYAEYAVIPERTNFSANREEKDRPKKLGSYENPPRYDSQLSPSKTMTSFSETNSFSRDGPKHVQDTNEKKFIASGEQAQTVKNMGLSQVGRNESFQDMQNLKPRKNQEICGVHIARTTEKKNFQSNSDVSFQGKQSRPTNSEWSFPESVPSTKELMDFQKQVQEIKENQEVTDKLKCQDIANQLLVSKEREIMLEKNTNSLTDLELNFLKTDLNISKNLGSSLHDSAKEREERNFLLNSIPNKESEAMTASVNFVKMSDNMHHPNKSETEKYDSYNPNESQSSSSLPDILSTLHDTPPSNPKTTEPDGSNKNDKHSESPIFDKTPPPNEKFSKSKVILSQSPYISHSLNSDTSSHDTEAELKRLTNLQSLRANQSIYKLAYDESITDQSEADSRSPSPVDPETQVPRSIINDEILIHEADSYSDAGSEDVELIPHRYESESFLNESKHMYVNKLSLAVELLRTQESLPYDEQFKRVSGESNLNLKETNPSATGKVNLGFVEDSSSFDSSEGHTGNRMPGASHIVASSQSRTGKNPRNSAAMSSFSFEDASNEPCEEAKEVVVEAAKARDNSEGVRAGYRRFQVQFRHYFTPRSTLVNPCLCCVIM